MDKLPDHLVLFDGVCNLCNRAVRYIIERDRKDLFRFASLQSDIALKIRRDHSIPENTDSMIYFRKGSVFTRSTAALKIAGDLGGRYCLFNIFIIVPRPLRDLLYDLIARNRYNWFGKTETCQMPDHSVKRKFIDNVSGQPFQNNKP
jgi:predicted DCC family thiol-disulfide oxidoreductase YuxK